MTEIADRRMRGEKNNLTQCTVCGKHILNELILSSDVTGKPVCSTCYAWEKEQRDRKAKYNNTVQEMNLDARRHLR